MLAENRFALKEWAVVCAALAAGRQLLILRKGGIHEDGGEFRVEHAEFWLFPTRFHQDPEELTEDARPLWEQARGDQPPEGFVRVSHYAVVQEVLHIEDESLLPNMAGRHVWSDRTVHQRFHYRNPGLFALVVRIYAAADPILFPDSPHFAGCRSWVDLPKELPTAGSAPVLTDAHFEQESAAIHAAIGERRIA